MTNDEIQEIALNNGFKLKEQPDGSMALNPYVFDFARELLARPELELEAVKKELKLAVAFHDVAVRERNDAWAELEIMKEEL